jgi:hypothetical protein
MSTVESVASASSKRRKTLAGATVAIGTLIAVAIAILFILIPAAGHTNGSVRPTARPQAPYVPLIQYRGTGQPPTVAGTQSTAAQLTTGLLRAEHSYGAVP